MTDIETKARAAFEWLHAKDSRVRNWDRHPEEDNGAELGRNTFRGMMGAAIAAEAPHPDLAHLFLNFVLRPDVAAQEARDDTVQERHTGSAFAAVHAAELVRLRGGELARKMMLIGGKHVD